MRELSIFDYKGKQVRTIQKDGETWWVLKDVCNVLDIKNSRRVYERLEDDEKGVTLSDTLGGRQNLQVINESGLYNVILRSDKAEAKPFRKWVTGEVLPSIRRTGSYIGNSDNAVAQLAIQVGKLTEMVTELYRERERPKQLTLACEPASIYSATELYQERKKPKQLALACEPTGIYSASELLRRNGLGMGICEFNAIMAEKGYLQEIRIRNIKGKSKGNFRTYKVLTEKGLEYGENRERLRCNKEPQPGYYPDSFLVLYRMVTEE